jgi:hypothetical protein
MTQGNFENPSPEKRVENAEAAPILTAKAVWSSPTLTRLDGKETLGIAPPGPSGAPKRQVPEEMIFFGS